jgi:hypothetical protein
MSPTATLSMDKVVALKMLNIASHHNVGPGKIMLDSITGLAM